MQGLTEYADGRREGMCAIERLIHHPAPIEAAAPHGRKTERRVIWMVPTPGLKAFAI